MKNPVATTAFGVLIPALLAVGWWAGRGLFVSETPAGAVLVAATTPAAKAVKSAAARGLKKAAAVNAGTPAPLTSATSGSSTGKDNTSRTVAELRVAATPADCRRLSQALAQIGTADAAEAIWQEAMRRPLGELRAAVLEGLDMATMPEAVSISASAFKITDEPDLLDAATRLVTRAADTETIHFLTELHAEPGATPEFQARIERVMGQIATEGAVDALSAVARQAGKPALALAAARSLLRLGTPHSLEQLQHAQNDLATQGTEGEALLGTLRRLTSGSDGSPQQHPD